MAARQRSRPGHVVPLAQLHPERADDLLGGTPLGALLGGLTAQAYGVRAAYLLLAVPAVLALGWLLASPVRGLRLPAE